MITATVIIEPFTFVKKKVEDSSMAGQMEKALTIGKRIKLLRKDLRLTQGKLGEKIYREKSIISKIENDEVELSSSIRLALCSVLGVREGWILTGEGEIFSKAPEKTRDVSDSPAEAAKADQIKISEDLFLATRVLESGTAYATALHLNIRSFAKAIDAEERITVLETNQRVFEKKVDAEIKVLRAEVNRLKATYEAPDGGDGHLADAEKKAM